MRLTKLLEVNTGQWFKLCRQMNKSSSQISGSSAQLKDSEFGPVIEGPTLIKSFIFSPKRSPSSVECAKKTKQLSSTEVILNFNNALHWHREESQLFRNNGMIWNWSQGIHSIWNLQMCFSLGPYPVLICWSCFHASCSFA